MRAESVVVVSLALLLSACASSGGGVASTGTTAGIGTTTKSRPATRKTPPRAHLQAVPGLEGVIGASSADLVRQFGPPRL